MDRPPNDLPEPFTLLLQALQAALRAADPAPRQPPESEAARLFRQWLAAAGAPWGAAASASPFTDLWARLLERIEAKVDRLAVALSAEPAPRRRASRRAADAGAARPAADVTIPSGPRQVRLVGGRAPAR